jgi:cell division protein FtsL
MSPRAAAAAVARGAAATVHAPARTRPARRPAPTRRRSGAAARRAARFDGIGLLDRLLRGPAYIAVIGILLAGIVFFNVDVLELNRGVAATDVRASQLKRQNAALTLTLAKLGSSERIQRVALERGMVLPQPGDVRYLKAGRDDAERALRVMTAPDPSSAAPLTPSIVTQQSGGAATGSPTSSEAVASAPTTTTAAPTTTTTTPTTTAPTQTTATTAPPAQQSPTTPATTTEAGAAAAPAQP